MSKVCFQTNISIYGFVLLVYIQQLVTEQGRPMPRGATNKNTGTTSRTTACFTIHPPKFAPVYYRQLSRKPIIISLPKGKLVHNPHERKVLHSMRTTTTNLLRWEITTHHPVRPNTLLVAVVFTCWLVSTINSFVLVLSHCQWGWAHVLKTAIKASNSWIICFPTHFAATSQQ